MKKLLLTVLVGGLAFTTFGQGQISMNSAGAGAVLKFTNTVTGTWAGSDVVVGLYWGETASSVNNLVPGFANVVQTPAAQAGYVLSSSGGGNRTIAERAGLETYFQLKAWSSGYASWEDALASGNPAALISKPGGSPIVSAVLTAAPGQPVPVIKWGGASTDPMLVELIPVPEPSVIALGVLGLAGLLFIRRRK